MKNKINHDTMKHAFDELLRTFVAKNKDYGNSFEQSLETYGLVASIVRMEDKFNRLKSLSASKTGAEIASESLSDTLLDLANYATMTAVYLNHKNDTKIDFIPNLFSQSVISRAPKSFSTREDDEGNILKEVEARPLSYDIQVKGNSQPFIYKETDWNGEEFEFIFDPGKTFKYELDGVTYETYGVISVDGDNLTLICPKVDPDDENKLYESGLKLAIWLRELVKKDSKFSVKTIEVLKLPLKKECSAYIFLTNPVINPLISRWITTGTYEMPVKDYLIGQNPVYDKTKECFWVKCLVSERTEEDNMVLRAVYFDDSKELLLEIKDKGIGVWTDPNGAFQNYTINDQNTRLFVTINDNWTKYSDIVDQNYTIKSYDFEDWSENGEK